MRDFWRRVALQAGPRAQFWGIAFLASAAMLGPLLYAKGIPAFLHDWDWPPDSAGLILHLSRGWSAWDQSGFGQPNAYICALPQTFVTWALAHILPSAAVLWLLLFVIWFVGIFGVARLACTALSLPPAWCIFAGITYMAGPVTLNKLAAGHVYFLESYAILPLFIAIALRSDKGRTSSLFLAALIGAIGTIQIQFIGIEVVILAIIAASGLIRFQTALKIALLMLPAVLPLFVGPTLLQNGTNVALSMQRAVLSWESVQSVFPMEALEARGYFAGYMEGLIPPWWSAAFLSFPLLSLCALPLRTGRRFKWMLVALAACGWLVVTGLKGPAAAFWSYIFLHVRAASVYRELYDVMPLVWLPYALLVATFIARIRLPIQWVLCCGLIALAIGPWWQLPTLSGAAPSAAQVSRMELLAPRNATGYVVWWPADGPIGPTGTRGGADPLDSSPVGALSALSEYEPWGTFAEASAFGNRGDWSSAARLLRSLGAAMVIDRLDLRSNPAQGATRKPVVASRGIVYVGAVSGYRAYAIVSPLGYISMERLRKLPENRPFDTTDLPRSLIHDDPRSGDLVAAFPFYRLSPAVGSCGDAAVIGLPRAYVKLHYRWFFAAEVPESTHCRWMARETILRLRPNALVVASRGSQAPSPPAPELTIKSIGNVAFRKVTNSWIAGDYSVAQPATLVMHTTFDPRWTLSIDGDGIRSAKTHAAANGWSIPKGRHHFIIYFAPARYVTALLISSALWSFALLIAVAVSSPGTLRLRAIFSR